MTAKFILKFFFLAFLSVLGGELFLFFYRKGRKGTQSLF